MTEPQLSDTKALIPQRAKLLKDSGIFFGLCGDFNVVLALPKGSDPGAFASRMPALVIDTGRIRLLRFASYPGKAIGCP